LKTFLRTVPILVLGLLAQGQTPRAPAQPRLLVELDPGHGGEDDGAKGRRGLLEKDVALELAKALAQELAEAGMEARLTRDSDVFIPLWDRAKKANADGADLFISLHLNADRSRQAKGSEVYFLSLGAGDRMAAELAAVENAGGKTAAELDPDSVVAGILNDLSQKAFLQDSERLAVVRSPSPHTPTPCPGEARTWSLQFGLFVRSNHSLPVAPESFVPVPRVRADPFRVPRPSADPHFRFELSVLASCGRKVRSVCRPPNG
jgi:hypothetical protein